MKSTIRIAYFGLSMMTTALLSGCAAGSLSPVTISEALSGIQVDLTKTGVVSTSHVQDWTTGQEAAFDRNVQTLQCNQHGPDPVVAMISGPVALSLSGSFTSSGSFSVGYSSTMPVFALQADASRTKAQTLTLPVQFVPLSALPDAEMTREVDYAGALLAQSDGLRETEGQRITNNRDALARHVQKLIEQFSGTCPEGPTHPFVGTFKQEQ
ncbi:hypothetical protein [Gluconobacter kondonii]|uniref:hypothetical protein n=1 Tax=Gluconobacter kondonii TaxID=941463 RepID=UPI001B8B7BF0|nr:hypothetical protein [Gluconobacter kondonii]MBS1054591.1 hypothetical protein [Gluconobacter kondonii]MBS1057834.1 hypothetical protein [Gluconobacter kondonii]